MRIIGSLVILSAVGISSALAVCGMDTCQTLERAALCSPLPVRGECQIEPWCVSLFSDCPWPTAHYQILRSHCWHTRSGHRRCRLVTDFHETP
jgi:hypothetical protein